VAEKPVEMLPRAAPLGGRIPWDVAFEMLGHPPSVREAEAREHHARAVPSETVDEFLAQEPERGGIHEDDAERSEMDDPSVAPEVEELAKIQIRSFHDLLTLIGCRSI
jgi:hypothetical protein